MRHDRFSIRSILFFVLTGAIFSLCTVTAGSRTLAEAAARFLLYTFLFAVLTYALSRLGHFLTRMEPRRLPGRLSFLNNPRRRHILLFFILLIAYFPTFLALCPAVFNYDGPIEVYQFLGPDGKLSAHHPLAHSLFLTGCLRLGYLLTGSYNKGLMLYSCLQWLLSVSVFTYLFIWMERRRTPFWVQALSFLYLVLNPFFHILIFSTTKDTISGILFLLLFLKLLDLTERPALFSNVRECPKDWLLFMLSAVGMCVFRKPGYYILAFTWIACLILLPGIRRTLLRTLGIATILSWFLMGPLIDLVGIPKGDAREMLSLPIQQTAAVWYGHTHGQITLEPEEAADILELIPESSLNSYHSQISDPVKSGFRTEVLKADPGRYVKLYLKLGLKYPDIYFDAARNMLSGFWAMGDRCHFMYLLYTDSFPGLLQDVCFTYRKNFLPAYRAFLEGSIQFIDRTPALLDIFGPVMPVWLMFACMMLGVAGQRRELTASCFLLFGQWGIQLLSPAVLIRYAFPMMVCLPALLALLSEGMRENGTSPAKHHIQ